MLNKYKTFLNTGNSEVIQKKSKFIGLALYVSTTEEVRAFLDITRKSNYGANHNCYAYRIEGPTILERQSDDGEPSGTAGLPILDVLRGEEIVNGLIIVSRYFGGTLLGTGGLVRAYGQGAKEAALNAGIIMKELYQSLSITSSYSHSGKIEYELNKADIPIGEILYTELVEFKIYLTIDQVERIIKHITDLTNAEAVISKCDLVYGGIVNGKFKLID